MTYDNTDERGEDAVARQRGGSERPQHVDTCRVYNCYGCEEIVDEAGHLPECDCFPNPHSAKCTLCICDRLRACEARVREWAADKERKYEFLSDTNDGYDDGYAAALDAARDAVAATYDEVMGFPPRATVLAAIDGIRNEVKR